MTQQFKALTFLTLLTLLATGCSTGNRANTIIAPQEAFEKSLSENYGEDLFDMTAYIPREWWTLFHDDQLTAFINKTLNQNPTLSIAYSNILLANANANRVRAALYPCLFYGADVSRQKLSTTALIPFNQTTGGATPLNSATAAAIEAAGGVIPLLPDGSPIFASGGVLGIPEYFTQYEMEFALRYDFDLWNKNKNSFRAAVGEYFANIADSAFTRLELGISVAKVYFKLQIDYKRAEIAAKLIANQDRYTELTEKRKSGNLDPVQLVYNSLINVSSARQKLLQIQADIAVNEIQLKTYMAGQFDEEFIDMHIEELPLPKVPVPDNLPLHLLASRPDIISQLWLIESAGKRIDVAKAGFYPDFNITALFGFQTLHLHKLFKWDSSYFNIDPAVSLPIFDGGRLLANFRASEVDYDTEIFRYNSLILNAVKEVLDGLVVLRNADQQLIETEVKLKQQNDILAITELRIKNNIGTELDYLVSEQGSLTAQDIEIVTLGNKIQAILSLIKALGGGYENCY